MACLLAWLGKRERSKKGIKEKREVSFERCKNWWMGLGTAGWLAVRLTHLAKVLLFVGYEKKRKGSCQMEKKKKKNTLLGSYFWR